jgi:hypothetical protein
MIARINPAGYRTKEVQMTEEPMNWVSLKPNHGEYWRLRLDHFHLDLEPISRVFTDNIPAHVAEATEAALGPE